jgi:hypothetical protein
MERFESWQFCQIAKIGEMPKPKLVFWPIAGSMERVGCKLWITSLIHTLLECDVAQNMVRRLEEF